MYGAESRLGGVQPDAFTTIITSGVTNNLRLFRILQPITVLQIGIHLTVASTVAAFELDFDRRILVASDTGRIAKGVGALIEPSIGHAIGTTIYKDLQVDLDPGDEVSVNCVTASTAGTGFPFMLYIPRAEVPGNFSEMFASA
jgi:hypothetical protein